MPERERRGWACIPLAFGAWYEEGDKAMSKLAGAGAARTNAPQFHGGRRPVRPPPPLPCSGRTRAPSSAAKSGTELMGRDIQPTKETRMTQSLGRDIQLKAFFRK